jgi:hypothetical protein
VYQKSKEVNKGVYTENIDGLNFELEMKKDFIKPFHPVLLNNQIEEFETRLTQHFFKKSRQNFGFEFDYTDWIRDFYRKLNSTRSVNSILVTDYISQTKMNSFDEMEFLFRLLQFLSFLRKFEGVKQCIDDQTYYIVEF